MLRLHVLAVTVVLAACNGNSLPPGGTTDMSMPDTPVPTPCSNGFLDGDETDTDCGGSCSPCGTGKGCKGAIDCGSAICANQMCAAPTCTDMVKNGTESDVDCGGSCITKCAEGQRCNDGPDCASLNCVNGLCAISLCEDKMLDGMETDVDCGGPVCMTKCGDGAMCVDGTDCGSGMCVNQRCKSTCPAGMGDCDGDPGNGCETDTLTSSTDCGRCRNRCPKDAPSCSMGVCVAPRVLLLGAETQGERIRLTDVQARLAATGAFSSVDVFDVSGTGAVPDPKMLLKYAVVLVWSDSSFLDGALLGDRLADFFDLGGRIVVAMTSFSDDPSLMLRGRFASGNYLLLGFGPVLNGPDALGALDEPNSPLLAGVQQLSADKAFLSDAKVTNGGVVVAHWASGRPMVVKGTVHGRRRVDLNFLPPSSQAFNPLWKGDGANLLRNALLYE